MLALGQQITIKTPAQLSGLIAEDSARWGQVVRENNIRNE
jgi:tripartite-type tricarboxylate transporter receptor subunit TctC